MTAWNHTEAPATYKYYIFAHDGKEGPVIGYYRLMVNYQANSWVSFKEAVLYDTYGVALVDAIYAKSIYPSLTVVIGRAVVDADPYFEMKVVE